MAIDETKEDRIVKQVQYEVDRKIREIENPKIIHELPNTFNALFKAMETTNNLLTQVVGLLTNDKYQIEQLDKQVRELKDQNIQLEERIRDYHASF